MEEQNYHIRIATTGTPSGAAEAISKVTAWWGDDVEGNSKETGDEFTIRFGETSVDFRVTETGAERIVWQVTDCNLHWLHDTKEWKGHTIIWDITPTGGNTTIDFTQIGLKPGVECYNDCEKGWNFYIGDSLLSLINTGKGKPDTSKARRGN
ncbi:MAG TPA: hypothetical protein VHA56_07135 [Mucilaginibacter sp.]|nr:hypothetical protein [Mucilaginibacter sp.]